VRRTLTTAKGGPMLTAPKTKGSRRTLKLSPTAPEDLRNHLERQLSEIDQAGDLWRENGLIFASESGEPLKRHYITTHQFKPCSSGRDCHRYGFTTSGILAPRFCSLT
jgi:integrase